VGGSISCNFLRLLTITIRKLCQIAQTRGLKGLVLFLKASSVCLQQSLAGHRLKDMGPLGVRFARTRSGYPKIIPAQHRLILINRTAGWSVLAKFYLTVFSSYRVIPLRGKLKLNTITDIGKKFDLDYFSKFLPNFVELLTKKNKRGLMEFYGENAKFRPLLKSSPHTGGVFNFNGLIFGGEKNNGFKKKKSSWASHPIPALFSLRSWQNPRNRKLYQTLILFARKFHPRLAGLIQACVVMDSEVENRDFVGKLGLKEEPAGKVRVFAMVDPWTQWLLDPLHRYLFNLLEQLPTDGTFNQQKPLIRLLNRDPKSLWSLDLSAATDRLPVSLQERLLNVLTVGNSEVDLGTLWRKLLTDREYLLMETDFNAHLVHQSVALKYGAGQPMGALSSWPMLALVHHYLIQLAAWLAGFPLHKLYTNYCILGDDLVIGDRKVKVIYLMLLSKLGVECGLAKSILSPKGTGAEFAKLTFIDKINVSPLSLKELDVARQDLASWSALARKWNLSFDRQARILGYGYKSRSRSVTRLNNALSAVYVSTILKADFNSDVLKIRKGSLFRNKQFEGSLVKHFYYTVLTPLKGQTIRDFSHFLDLTPEGVAKDTVADSYDIISSEYLRGFLDKESWMALWRAVFEDCKFITLRAYMEVITRINNFNPDKSSFDEALQLYLRLTRLKAVPAVQQFDMTGIPLSDRDSKDLPYQARMFRLWTRLVPRVVKLMKEVTFAPNDFTGSMRELNQAIDESLLHERVGLYLTNAERDKDIFDDWLACNMSGSNLELDFIANRDLNKRNRYWHMKWWETLGKDRANHLSRFAFSDSFRF